MKTENVYKVFLLCVYKKFLSQRKILIYKRKAKQHFRLHIGKTMKRENLMEVTNHTSDLKYEILALFVNH